MILTCRKAENLWLESNPNRLKLCKEEGTIIRLNKFTLGGKVPQIPILIYNTVLQGSQISFPQIKTDSLAWEKSLFAYKFLQRTEEVPDFICEIETKTVELNVIYST